MLAGTAVAVAVVASVATFLTGQGQPQPQQQAIAQKTHDPIARASAPLTPKAAAKVEVSGATRSTITLAWDDPNDGRAAYVVLVDAGATQLPPQKADGATSHIVQGLQPGTSYCLTVQTGTGAVTPVTMPLCTRTAP